MEEAEFQGQQLDDLLETMEQSFMEEEEEGSENNEAGTEQVMNFIPTNLNLNRIQNRVAYFCGRDKLCKIQLQKREPDDNSNLLLPWV